MTTTLTPHAPICMIGTIDDIVQIAHHCCTAAATLLTLHQRETDSGRAAKITRLGTQTAELHANLTKAPTRATVVEDRGTLRRLIRQTHELGLSDVETLLEAALAAASKF